MSPALAGRFFTTSATWEASRTETPNKRKITVFFTPKKIMNLIKRPPEAGFKDPEKLIRRKLPKDRLNDCLPSCAPENYSSIILFFKKKNECRPCTHLWGAQACCVPLCLAKQLLFFSWLIMSTLWDPVNCSLWGFPVLHHFLDLARQVGDGKAINLFFSVSPKTLVSKIQFGTSTQKLSFWHQNCDIIRNMYLVFLPFLAQSF